MIPALAPRYGGPSYAVLGMVRALRELGVDAEVATTDADGPGARLPVEFERLLDLGGCPVRFFRRDFGEALKFSRGLSNWLDLHAAEYDLVHVHAVFSHACVAAGRACARSGVPYLVRPLGTLDPWSLAQKPLRKRVFWVLAGRALLRGSAAVHYTSEAERVRVEKPLRLSGGVVVPIGVDPAPPPSPASDPPYVLVMGRLHPKKRMELVLEAFGRLKCLPGTGTWEVWVVGSGEPDYERHLRDMARERCGQRVRFLGWLSGQEKSRVLGGASLLALLSRQENFGIVVAEAMAAGVPTLVSPEVDLSLDVARAHAGWVVEARVDALMDTLRRVSEDPAERAARGASGRAWAETHYAWSSIGGQLLELYRRLAPGQRCGAVGSGHRKAPAL